MCLCLCLCPFLRHPCKGEAFGPYVPRLGGAAIAAPPNSPPAPPTPAARTCVHMPNVGVTAFHFVVLLQRRLNVGGHLQVVRILQERCAVQNTSLVALQYRRSHAHTQSMCASSSAAHHWTIGVMAQPGSAPLAAPQPSPACMIACVAGTACGAPGCIGSSPVSSSAAGSWTRCAPASGCSPGPLGGPARAMCHVCAGPAGG